MSSLPVTAAALAAWNDEQRRLIKEVIAPGLTDPELALFAQICQATGLSPFANQICAIKRNAWNPATGKTEPKMSVQTTIHGLRLIADRTGRYAPGPTATFTYNDAGRLITATAYVQKWAQGAWHLVTETVYWDEYVQTNRDGKPVALWASKPHVMLAKTAEAMALRRAFPAETAGLYTDDEMGSADPLATAPTPPQRPALPTPAVVTDIYQRAQAAVEEQPSTDPREVLLGQVREAKARLHEMTGSWSNKATATFCTRAFGREVTSFADLSDEELTALLDVFEGRRHYDQESGDIGPLVKDEEDLPLDVTPLGVA